jgi:hypothetical protein
VTALRLKALHLANSADYTYSKSYLGLLSSIGCMLGVALCNIMALPAILKYVKERFGGKKPLPNTAPDIGDRVCNNYATRSFFSRIGIYTRSVMSTKPEGEDRTTILVNAAPLSHIDNNIQSDRITDDLNGHDDEFWVEVRESPVSPSDRDIEKQEETRHPQ